MARREPILDNAAPVTAGALYVADGKVVISAITGTVADLKTALGATEVRAINIRERRDPDLFSDLQLAASPIIGGGGPSNNFNTYVVALVL